MAKNNNNSPTKVVTGKVRLSYVHLLEPYAFDSNPDKEQYSCSILIDKSDKATVAKVQAAINAAIEAGKVSKWNNKVPAKMWNPLRDGDIEKPDEEVYAGKFYLNAKSNQKPGLVDRDLNRIIDPDEIYSGMYARVSLSFYPFDVSGNRGVGVGLNNVQKVGDGERLGGRSNAEDDFDEYEADDDDFEDEGGFLD